MNRPFLALPAIALAALLGAAALRAQDPTSSRPTDPQSPGSQRSTTRPRPAEAKRDRLWRDVVEAMPREERARFLRLSQEEKEAVVRLAIAKRAAEEEAAFLASLVEAERVELAELADRPDKRRRRMVELRLEQHFRRAVDEARSRGVLNEDEATRLAAAPAIERAKAVIELQKRTFLATHREDLAAAPRRERDRLAKIPADEFFDDPFVQDFKSFRFLSKPEVEKFRRLDDEAAGRLVLALTGQDFDVAAASAVFSAERTRSLQGLKAEERRRVGRDLRRAASGPQRGLFMPPPELMDEMTDAEIRAFLKLGNVERRAALIKRFGVLRVFEARRSDLQSRNGPKIGELLRRLPEEEQKNLLEQTPEEIRRELFRRFPDEFSGPGEGERQGPGGRSGNDSGPGGGRPGGRPSGPPPGGRPPRGERPDRPGRPDGPGRGSRDGDDSPQPSGRGDRPARPTPGGNPESRPESGPASRPESGPESRPRRPL